MVLQNIFYRFTKLLTGTYETEFTALIAETLLFSFEAKSELSLY